MDKDLKQTDHLKSSSHASKKIVALSFVAAVQTVSCISGRRQGAAPVRESTPLLSLSLSEFKKIQKETANTVSEIFAKPDEALAKSHAQAAFFKAIEKDDLKEVQCLFQNQQIRPNTAENLLNLLVRALQCKREKIFNFLFDEFLKIFDTSDLECLYAKNEEGQTLLHVVIRHRLKPTIESLVDKLPLQGLCVGDNQGRTPLDLAIASNQIHTVELLVKKKLPAQELVKGVILALKYQDTLSFRYKREKIVHCLLKALLEQCAVSSLGHLSAKDEKGRTLLHLLIRRGDINGVRLLANELPLEALCAQDNKRRRPIVLAARSKSPKMFQILFDKLIDSLGEDEAVKTLFNETGSSVFASAYLSKHRDLAGLLNNSHLQMPTFLVRGYNMFKYIIKTLSGSLTFDQLMTIGHEIDDIEFAGMLYSRYARSLRSLIAPYIEQKAAESGIKISRLKFHEAQKRKKRDCIKGKQYDRAANVDEGYVSG